MYQRLKPVAFGPKVMSKFRVVAALGRAGKGKRGLEMVRSS